MSNSPSKDSPIDRSKRSRFEADSWDSDYEEDDHDDRHPKRQAMHDPKTKTPYFKTENSEKPYIKIEDSEEPYFKAEESEMPTRKKKRTDNEKQGDTNGSMSLRSVVNAKDAGMIIGKGGKHVNEIRDISTARVTISKKVQGAQEQILTVHGSLHTISRAFGLIGERLVSESTRSDDDKKSDRGTTSVRLLIPDGQMGGLIGKGGAKIKSIQEQSFARVSASSDCLPMSDERIVTIHGTPFSIEQAVYLIVVILMGETRETREKDRVVQYKPNTMKSTKSSNKNHNHSTNSNDDNNNNNTISSNGNGQSFISMNQPAVMMGHGGMMPMGAVPMNMGMNMNMNMGMGMGMGQLYYPNNSVMYDGMMMSPRQSMPTIRTSQTQRIYIPNDMVGCVIGKRGSTINEIRDMSGSQITIDSSQGNRERLITVTGSPESNQIALYLLYSKLEAEKTKLGIR